MFLNECLEKIVEIQYSTTSLNYIYVLAHSQKSPVSEKFDKNMFYIIKRDLLKSMESFALSEICEQQFEIKSVEELQTFSQNSGPNLHSFEILFFGGSNQIYSLCPVIPRRGVILSNDKFQSILSDLKSKGETTYREKMMMAKKALRQNSEQSVLEFPENIL